MTKRHSRSRRGKDTPGWLWMLLGLTMGLVVAGYIWLSDIRAPLDAMAPQQGRAPQPRPSTAAPERETQAQAEPRTQTQPQIETEEPTPQASAAARPAPPAPAAQTASSRFQFYENLPQSEVVVVPDAGSAPPPAATRAPAPVEEPGSYMLQVGSFRSHADADRRKASIALLGYESQIERATVNGNVVHRVLVGPITDLGALDVARRRLRDENFDTLVLKAAK